MRRRRDDDRAPAEIAELRAIEAALAGEGVQDEHLEIAALALAVRADCPRPAAEFAARLDAAAHNGFPEPGGVTGVRPGRGKRMRAIRRPARPRRFLPLEIGAATTVFIVAVALAMSGALEGGDGPGGAKPDTGQKARGEAVPAAQSGEGGASAGDSSAAGGAGSAALSQRSASTPPIAPGAPVDVVPRARARKVERSAALTLAPGRDQVEEVADEVIRTTDRHNGFVLRSSVQSGEDRTGAELELRIPSTRLQSAIADLSKLAHVRSREQDANDITARFGGPRRRLADAAAERQGLLRQLALAQTANQTASVRARLRLVDDRIDRARSSLRRLENRVSYAAVLVSVDPRRSSGGGTQGAWSAGDALHDGVSILGVALAIAVVAGALLVPLALMGLGLWWAQRLYARRRRDRALS